MEDLSDHLFPNYARLPVSFIRGDGVWLWDDEGRRCLDAVAGIAVCSLGHAHPVIAETLAKQSRKLLHTSNLYRIRAQEKLAEKLSAITGMDAVFFCNSGTEACEAAIKLARLHACKKGNQAPNLIVMENAFHGRTLGALAASDMKSETFEPLPKGFTRVPFDDVSAVESAAVENPEICAVMVEPIQGESGINPGGDDYLPKLRHLCDKHDLLLILDEVQTGVGRTGEWYCFRHTQSRPDVLITAKALGNGIPIGACLANKEIASQFTAGTHGSTFGGNPLACAAGLAVLETMETEDLCGRAAEIGNYLLSSLHSALDSVDRVKAIRGMGLMIGIELDTPCKTLTADALQAGLLINVTAQKVVRLLPPLILEKRHADRIVETLHDVIINFTGERK